MLSIIQGASPPGKATERVPCTYRLGSPVGFAGACQSLAGSLENAVCVD